MTNNFLNPFKPGAGHQPPYLAGRESEKEQFMRLLKQEIILENLILTGLRGIGKTVLLESFKPLAIKEGWFWTGSSLSESASVTEEALITRILTDISLVTANIVVNETETIAPGFQTEKNVVSQKLDLNFLLNYYKNEPGLRSDKLKNILEFVWMHISKDKATKGLIFAYDEAQNMTDHPKEKEYPLSILLDVFQSIQRKDIPFMLVLAGLPTLFPKLVETRTYTERMFRVLTLTKLNDVDSRAAIHKPIEAMNSPVGFDDNSVNLIIAASGGYPYFIQFICKEVFDVFSQKMSRGDNDMGVPLYEIITKLDTDFFSGRWMRATDRQRDLLSVISQLKNSDEEFTVAEIVEEAKKLPKAMSSSQVSQMLTMLIKNGLIYKNRYSKYSFAVPLFGEFIKRQNYANLIRNI